MAGSDLVISVGATIKDLERQMKAASRVAEQAADDIEAKFRKANPTLTGDFGLGVLKGAIAGISLEKITRGFVDANKEISSFGDTAKRVGLDLAEFQKLRLAAQGEGVSGKAFDAGIEGLAKSLNEARREENELSKLLDANGVKFKDRKGDVISTNEALAVAADLISRAATEMDKVAIADKLGIPKDFIPLLEGGAAALAEMARKAGEAGSILDSDVIAKAKEFDTAWNNAWAAFESNAKGAVVRAGQWLADLGTLAQKVGNSDLANQLNQAMRSAFPEGYKEYDRQQRANFRQSELRSQDDAGPLVVSVKKPPTKIPGKTSGGGGGGGGKSEEEQAQDRLDRYVETLARQNSVLDAQIATFGKSNAEKRAAVELAKAQVDLNKLDEADRQKAIDNLTKEIALSEQKREKLDELKAAQKGLNDAQKFFGNAAVDALEDLIVNGAKAEDVVKRLAASLAKAAIQAALMGTGPLAGIFGTAGTGGNMGGLFGALFNRASGGHVNAGQAYTVGENGRETFVPTTPGKIIPAGRGGGGLTVNVQNNTPAQVDTAPRSDGSVDIIIRQVEGAMAQRFVRGQGSLSQAFGAVSTNRHRRG